MNYREVEKIAREMVNGYSREDFEKLMLEQYKAIKPEDIKREVYRQAEKSEEAKREIEESGEELSPEDRRYYNDIKMTETVVKLWGVKGLKEQERMNICAVIVHDRIQAYMMKRVADQVIERGMI